MHFLKKLRDLVNLFSVFVGKGSVKETHLKQEIIVADIRNFLSVRFFRWLNQLSPNLGIFQVTRFICPPL